MIEVVVRLEPDGVEDSLVLQVLVDVRGGEGRVSPQVELLAHLPVPINYWGEELTPPVSRVDVAGSQDRPLAVPVVVEAEERMVTGRFKEAVVGRAFLAAVDGRLGAVYVEHHLLRLGERHCLGDPGAVEGGKRVDVLILGKDVRLEAGHRSRACRRPVESPLAYGRPHRRVSGQSLLVIHVLVSGEPRVDRLPEQARYPVLDVLARPPLDYQIPCHLGRTHHLVQLSYCQKTGVRSYLRSPELQPQSAVELKPNVPVFQGTRWVFFHWNLALPELPILVHP